MKLFLGLAILLATCSWANAQTWPTYRNDHARSGLSHQAIDAKNLELTWSWSPGLPPDPAWDGPARWDAYARIRDLPAMRQYDACFHPVSDGESVYFGSSSQDTLTALNLKNGSTEWFFVAGGPIRLAPTIEADKILFGCDDGNAYCLNRKTGKLIWKFNPSANQSAEQRRLINNDRLISFYPVRTGITVRDGLAYFAGSFLPWRESYLCAVDVKTGNVGKSKNTFVVRHENATLEGSLLVAENRLIVPQGRVAPLLFDRANGKSLGSLPGGGGVTIVLTESGEVVRTEGGTAARAGQVGVFKGKERVASFPRGRSLVIRGDSFYVIDGQKLFAAQRDTNELRWQRAVDEPLEIIMAGDTLFVGGRDHVTAVSAMDGQIVWSAKIEGRVFGLAVAGGKLIASTDTGKIYVYSTTAPAAYSRIPPATETRTSPRVPTVRRKNLLHRWVFHRSAMETSDHQPVGGTELNNITVQDQAGSAPLTLAGTATSCRIGTSEIIESIKLDNSLFPINESVARRLPDDAITVESWVRVDQPATWGGIIGCIQDDGATEHGWLLGYRDDKFCFAVAGDGGGLTYLTATKSFEPGSWNHVVGTYNGKEMRLYVNGSLAATSSAESGPISYANKRIFTLGAYRDANESFPLVGEIHDVQIFATASEATTIARLYSAQSKEFESPPSSEKPADRFVIQGPVSRTISPGVVEISFETAEACPSVIDRITPDGIRRFVNPSPTTHHQLTITGLPFRRELQFQIRDGETDQSRISASFNLDTHFDWTHSSTIPPTPSIENLIEQSPNPRGLAFLMGAGLANDAVNLSRQSELTVILVVESESVAQKIKHQWAANPDLYYGNELSVTATPIRLLPAACASVVVSSEDIDVVRRLVRPEGGILHDGTDVVWTRNAVAESGTWSHMYGLADNSAFGGESLSNASSRKDLLTQWIGRPGPRYQTDRQNRKPSPLAVGGRLFLQGQQRIISIDAFSGAILWSVETPTVMRWNVPHDCSNWCADENGIFVAAENRAWFMEGRDGNITRQFQLPLGPDDSTEKNWGYIARYNDQLLGTTVSTPAIYTQWWGKTQWFDSTGGDDTHVVAGDSLFSLDQQTGDLHWSYSGLVLHPTITIMDGSIYFVEDVTPQHIDSPNRRISLGSDQQHELVCLDVVTGQLQWRRPVAPFSGHLASLYLAGGGSAGKRSLVLAASESTQKEFMVQAINPQNGSPVWNRTIAWEATHHGKHISRPAIESELLYLRPEVLNLATGETIQRGFPGGHGCSSYTLSKNGLFSRLGETTWWDVRNDRVNRFSRIRTDCWISVVPAQGMLLSAEGGGGCSCGTWLETSMGFLPRSVDEELPDK